jgi:hypothetical protein
LADQTWFGVGATWIDEKEPPKLWRQERVEELFNDRTFAPELKDQVRIEFFENWRRSARGETYLVELSQSQNHRRLVENIHISQCYSCKQITIWKYDTILFPKELYEVEANGDLAEDIRQDFDEARAVLDISPRSAAALLRLCIQKLCLQLGYQGKDLNADIGEMVKAGLAPQVQMALDTVRVIGNESVHPGTMDLRDNRETATKLFSLVNRIAYDTITHPRELNQLYSSLPPAKLEGIEKRDKGKS